MLVKIVLPRVDVKKQWYPTGATDKSSVCDFRHLASKKE